MGPATETVAALGTSRRVFAPYFHIAVTLHVCPYRGEKFSSIDVQREEEITVVCAGEGMEWDSKIPNRPGVVG